MSVEQGITGSTRIVPHLWFVGDAVEAANFYASLFPDSRIDNVTRISADTPSGPAGSIPVVQFTLAGQRFSAISTAPDAPGLHESFNHTVSFMVNCDTQDEIDRLWDALSSGGATERCGWLRDRYGLSWQIVPTALGAMLADSDRARAQRVTQAMLQMKKFDIDLLQRAYAGSGAAVGANDRAAQ